MEARDNYYCVVHPMQGADGQVIQPACTPNTDEAAERFRVFKASINRAATVMGLSMQIDAQDPTLGMPAYHLMIHIARRLANLCQRQRTEVPEMAATLAVTDPRDFLIVATDVVRLEALMTEIEQGVYGRWIPAPAPIVGRMPPRKLLTIASAGLLFSTALFFTPKEWTLYGIRPNEVRPSE
jgi:hypothetical protein